MKGPPWGSHWRLWALQGSWNPKSMQALGWMSVLAPWLDQKGWDRDRQQACLRRYSSFANANPPLAGLALGLAMRLEEDGDGDPAASANAVSHALGALGDPLFWTGVRPALVWTGALLGVLFHPVWVAVAWLVFLLGQGVVRSVALREGYRRGRTLTTLLRHPGFGQATRGFRVAAAAAALAVSTALLTRVDATDPVPVAIVLGVGAMGAWRQWNAGLVLGLVVAALWTASRFGAMGS